ncbi:MAG: 2-oxoisovalerate dehydrogenase [Actinobacteria bacterium RBG_16_67_10]|nr:MAG: 2-oxoisovalerate dehydrogenase [Actinobacteria bacterium RBG_16_67_10]
MTEISMARALNEALDVALGNDDRVVLLGEDVGSTGGVFRITDGLLERHGPSRVFDTPVAESGIVGAAFGMAVAGLRPVAELQFLGFSYPAFDQIVSHVGRIRNRSNHRFTAPLVIRIPYGGGIGAAEHHSESNEAIYAHTPGVKVVVPSSPTDAKGLLLAAIADPDPVIFLEPIRLYRAVKEEVPEGHYTVPIGAARVVGEGTDVTLISYGAMMRDVIWAADVLATDGIAAEVIDLRTLAPLDHDAISRSAAKTGRVVVAVEAHRSGSLASEVAAIVQERALYSMLAPVERVTGYDTVVPLKRSEKHYIPGVGRIVAAARRALEA